MSAPNVFANVRSLSPRLRRAIALYASGAVGTKKEASALAGMHPGYLTLMTNNNMLAQAELRRVMAGVDAANVDMATLLHKLSIKAIAVIEQTMDDASSEALRLKAAQDLADRGPQTSKVQRHQVEQFNINGKDAKAIAEAMVEAARIRQEYAHLSVGSHDATGATLLTDGSGPTGPVG